MHKLRLICRDQKVSGTKRSVFMRGLWSFLLIISCFTVRAAIKLPMLISDGMVLQRNVAIPVWGWGTPMDKITITFHDKTYTTTVSTDGKWTAKLDPQPAGGPFDMVIKGNSDEVKVKNILLGDVWICSGQSNMALDFNYLKAVYPTEIAQSANDQIRHILVNRTYSSVPETNFKSAGWKPASPQNLPAFTAAGYFFAVELYKVYHVPIGLINSSYGGTLAEAWTNEQNISQFPQFTKDLNLLKDTAALAATIRANKKDMADWDKKIADGDAGYDASKKAIWVGSDLNDSAWKTMAEPNYWFRTGLPNVHGVVWLRKEIDVPATAAGTEAMLKLGRMADADITYFNGEKIGDSPNRDRVREYKVPGNLVKAGKNIITIRLVNYNGDGGMIPGVPLQLVAGTVTVSLNGDWKVQPGMVSAAKPSGFDPKNLPTSLYNAMIAPLLPCAIKGVIWYQGEFNAHRAYEYRTLFPALISGWRSQFKQGDFPFIFQQLPNFQNPVAKPSEHDWAELREAQLMTLSKEPKTAMSVAIDIGEGILHPLNKKDIGIRLALAARKLAYGEDKLVASGPVYKSVKIDNDKAIISFGSTGSGLIAKGGGPLKYFAIAGADKKFVWADAVISGNTVIVSSKEVPNPVSVRYAWAANPEGCNLYNQEGLPASPFRTDDWPGITVNNNK